MPMKETGPATDFEVVDRFDGGVGWLAHPEEGMQRASHALRAGERSEAAADASDGGDGVWVVDPVDAEGVDDLLAELGDVRGVVVLMDRHQRDAAAVANRHDVPVYVPEFVDRAFDAPTETFSGRLPGTDYELVRTVDLPGWREGALYDGDGGTLVVADVLGTADYFVAGGERIGVTPVFRVKPPSALRRFAPERILTGHGRGVMEDGAAALEDALDGALRRAPRAWLKGLKALV